MKINGFKDALIKLGIEDFEDQIINSHSRGETFHCLEYIELANNIIFLDNGGKTFRQEFLEMVDYAEKNWERPESVYQHLLRIMVPILRGQKQN